MKTKQALSLLVLLATSGTSSADDRGTTHHSSVDSRGATITTDTAQSSASNADGSSNNSTEVTTTIDPKGLANKTSAKSVRRIDNEANGDFSESRVIKHADGTVETISSEKTTNDHWQDKGKTQHKRDVHSIDPKGLGNKQSLETREDTSYDATGASTKTTTQLLNGKEISKSDLAKDK